MRELLEALAFDPAVEPAAAPRPRRWYILGTLAILAAARQGGRGRGFQ
jgi:hypothetical protein